MQTKLASVLTILSVILTTIAVSIFALSQVAAIALAVIGGLALLAWLAIGSPADDLSDGVVAPYLFAGTSCP